MSTNVCVYTFYSDYYETGCQHSIEEYDYDNIVPTYCPYCGDKIEKG